MGSSYQDVLKLWNPKNVRPFIKAWKDLSPEEKKSAIEKAYDISSVGRDPEWRFFFRVVDAIEQKEKDKKDLEQNRDKPDPELYENTSIREVNGSLKSLIKDPHADRDFVELVGSKDVAYNRALLRKIRSKTHGGMVTLPEKDKWKVRYLVWWIRAQEKSNR